MTPEILLASFTFQAFLLFARLGSAIFVFPALSDNSIPARARLVLAAGATLVLLPLLHGQLPGLPAQSSQLVFMVGSEIVIGILLGLSARLYMAALSFAGEMIAFMAGFQSASLFDPQSGASTVAPTIFLTLTAGVLILVLNLHHALIQGVVASYTVFVPGHLPPVGNVTTAVVNIFAQFTALGLQIAAPVVIAGFLVNLAFGIFNRLIPQIQMFFLTVPLSITLSMLLLAVALTSVFTLFTARLQDNLLIMQQDANQ